MAMMALRARSAPCSRRQRLQLRRQCARGRGQQRKRRQRNRLPTGSRAHSFSCIVFMFAYLACSTQSSCFHLFHFQSHIFIFPNFLFQIRSKSINQCVVRTGRDEKTSKTTSQCSETFTSQRDLSVRKFSNSRKFAHFSWGISQRIYKTRGTTVLPVRRAAATMNSKAMRMLLNPPGSVSNRMYSPLPSR